MAGSDKDIAKSDCPAPHGLGRKAFLSTLGGGAVASAVVFSDALPIALVILGVILTVTLGVVAVALLVKGDERTPFERLMCLLGMLLGDRTGMVLFMQQSTTDIHEALPPTLAAIEIEVEDRSA
jgi:hypothetical protein